MSLVLRRRAVQLKEVRDLFLTQIWVRSRSVPGDMFYLWCWCWTWWRCRCWPVVLVRTRAILKYAILREYHSLGVPHWQCDSASYSVAIPSEGIASSNTSAGSCCCWAMQHPQVFEHARRSYWCCCFVYFQHKGPGCCYNIICRTICQHARPYVCIYM